MSASDGRDFVLRLRPPTPATAAWMIDFCGHLQQELWRAYGDQIEAYWMATDPQQPIYGRLQSPVDPVPQTGADAPAGHDAPPTRLPLWPTGASPAMDTAASSISWRSARVDPRVSRNPKWITATAAIGSVPDRRRRTASSSKLVPDAHLAAIALGHGLILCSTDGDFARFKDLRWENPIGA